MLRTIKRNIKYWIQRRTRGWSDDECWNLDWEFIKWVNVRLKQYKYDASKVVDLESHKFRYKGRKYTQLELINKVIRITEEIKKEDNFYNYNNFENINKKKNEMFDILKIIFWTLWW